MEHAKRNQYKISSTSTQTPTSSVPSLSFTNTPNPTNNNSDDSPSLYLITFLATLFLLFLISGGIVIRAIILRRRLRRGVDDASVAGFILPTNFEGRGSNKGFSEEPKLYEAWVQPAGDEKWECMMPISAQIHFNPSVTLTPKTTDADATNTISSTRTRTLSIPNRITHWRRSIPISPTPNSDHQSPSVPFTVSRLTPGGDDNKGNVQVSVLVAMPSPKSKSSFSMDKGEDIEAVVPEIAVGVAQLPYRVSRSPEVSTLKLERGYT